MYWCPSCATWRTTPDCKVCRLRGRLERLEDENLRLYRSLPFEERNRRRKDEESLSEPTVYPTKGTDEEKEEWAVGELTRHINRVRRDNARLKKDKERKC